MTTERISRRGFIRSATAAAGLAQLGLAQPGPRSQRRPNILLIITDQQSYTMLSCAGNRWVNTPALDRLARAGTRFSRAYVTNPVCLPSRFSLMTGLYPSAVGVRFNGSDPSNRVNEMPERTLGALLSKAGYETAYCGKVHLPGPMADIRRCGFQLLTPDQRDGCAQAAIEFLRRKHDKPFLLVASFINPHDICFMAITDYYGELWRAPQEVQKTLGSALQMPPGVSPEEFFARRCPPLPSNFEIPFGEPDAVTWLVKLRPFRNYARLKWSEQQWRRHRWAYCRLTENVDSQIGRVLDALQQTGLDEETLVIMTSDHGDMDSAHRLEHKSVLYEEATRVPLIIRPPGQRQPGRVDEKHLISTGLDLLPTICDYAGIQPPPGLQGMSLRPLIEGEAPGRWRETLFVESEIGYMVTDGRYKYCAFDPDKGFLRDSFVDLDADPGEMVNLVGEGFTRKHVKRLQEQMAAWQRQIGIEFAMPQIYS